MDAPLVLAGNPSERAVDVGWMVRVCGFFSGTRPDLSQGNLHRRSSVSYDACVKANSMVLTAKRQGLNDPRRPAGDIQGQRTF